MPTRIFLDTEFTALRQHAQLISVGLTAENGDVFYAELTDFDPAAAHPWLRDNVLPQLSGSLLPVADTAKPAATMLCRGTQQEVAAALRRWLARFGGAGAVQMWADVPAWDWVLFCELFGGAFDLPEQVHYIVRDLATWLEMRGFDPDMRRESLGEVEFAHPALHLVKHHALYDALLERAVLERLGDKL